MQEVTADRISKPKLREGPHRGELQRRQSKQFLDECEESFGHRLKRGSIPAGVLAQLRF